MLTSSNQYLRPDYLTPLPTTLDAKKSPLALLAQTCSAIGADTPNPKLISAAEKASAKSGHKYVEPTRERSPPAAVPAAHDNKPSFKPYESCLTARDKTRTPEERGSSAPHPRTPLSGKGSAAGTPAPAAQTRCASNQSCSSRTSPSGHRKTPSDKSEGRTGSPRDSPAPARSSETSKSTFGGGGADNKELSTNYKQNVVPVSSSAFLSALPPGGFPLPVDLMTSSLMAAQHHALKSGLNPYLAYARMKIPGGSEMGACRDPYCTGCSLSSHLLKAACPAGCAHCDHAKAPFALTASHPAAAAYAHAQLAALAAASQLPFVCSWMGGETAYCGKRFGSSEELLQHLRSHTANGEGGAASGAGLALLGATHPLLQRTYPTPPLSPLTSRFHPYSKPTASQLVSPQMPFPMPPHPSLAAYFPSYPLFGPRALHP